ncbi:hypothetical protein ACKWTF_004360 [Chironomus riparius]
MAGIFKFNSTNSGGDKNNLPAKPSFSGPASLSTPTRVPNRVGLFMGSHDGDISFNGCGVQQKTLTNCPSSPASQGHSLREHEEQISALRKENFNLKLRIYFLEEKPTATNLLTKSSSLSNSCLNMNTIESISKQNIDLKVENESLRKELKEKQDLLIQASKAMEMLENQHKKESNQAQMIIDDLNHKIEAMTHEIKTLEKVLIESNHNNDTGFSDFLGAIDSKDIESQRKIAEFELIMRSFSEQNEQLCQKIEKMESQRCDMTRKLNQLNYENAELREKLEEVEKFSDRDGMKRLQDECYESKRKLAEAITQFDEIERKLYEKSQAHEKSLQVIQKACDHIEDLELHVEQLKSSQPNSLSSTESAKNDEQFSHASGIILKLRQQIEQITNEKNEEINQLKEELRKKSRLSFAPLSNSNFNTFDTSQNILQSINFPINEISFNEVIDRNKSAQKKIHFLKQRLSSNDTQNKIENEFLQLQLKEAQNDVYESEAVLRQSVAFCGILLERLEELVNFLTSLLNKSDLSGLLGNELKRAITKAVDRSLDLSRGSNKNQFSISQNTNLSDMSMIDLVDSFASSTVADSMIDSLENFKTEVDSNKMFKSNTPVNTSSIKGHKSQKNMRRSLASAMLKHQSESEEWSEPDRDISRERVGLGKADEVLLTHQRTSTTSDEEEGENNEDGNEHKLVRKSDWKLLNERVKSLEALLQERNDKILEVSGSLLNAEKDTTEKILQIKKKLEETESNVQHYKNLYQQVTTEHSDVLKSLKEKEEAMEVVKKEKDQFNVELKVLSSKYESQVGSNHEMRNKMHDLENKLQSLKVEYELKCTTYDQLLTVSEKREQAFKDELQQNWIRKTIYNQLLLELDRKQSRLKDYQQKFAALEGEMRIMQSQLAENEEKLERISKSLDSATLQLSSNAVERSKTLNERRSLEAKLKKVNEDYQKVNIEKQELNLKIADLEVFNAKLQNKLLIGEKLHIGTHLSDASGYVSEDAIAPRSLSFSSTDEKDVEAFSNCNSCKKLANEMNEIKRNLHLSKRSLEIAYSKLRNQNLRKAQIEMDIKQQIAKTQTVLQNVRANMETELNRTTPVKKECKEEV